MFNPSSRFPLVFAAALHNCITTGCWHCNSWGSYADRGRHCIRQQDGCPSPAKLPKYYTHWLENASASNCILRYPANTTHFQDSWSLLFVHPSVSMAFQRNTRFLRWNGKETLKQWAQDPMVIHGPWWNHPIGLWVSRCLWCPTGIPACKGHPVLRSGFSLRWTERFVGHEFGVLAHMAQNCHDITSSCISYVVLVCLGDKGIQIESDGERACDIVESRTFQAKEWPQDFRCQRCLQMLQLRATWLDTPDFRKLKPGFKHFQAISARTSRFWRISISGNDDQVFYQSGSWLFNVFLCFSQVRIISYLVNLNDLVKRDATDATDATDPEALEDDAIPQARTGFFTITTAYNSYASYASYAELVSLVDVTWFWMVVVMVVMVVVVLEWKLASSRKTRPIRMNIMWLIEWLTVYRLCNINNLIIYIYIYIIYRWYTNDMHVRYSNNIYMLWHCAFGL